MTTVQVADEVSPIVFKPTACVTEKYIYLELEKTGWNTSFRIKTDDHTGWQGFVPPQGECLVIAFPREGKAHVDEELREGAITLKEFDFLASQVVSLQQRYQSVFTSEF